MAKRESSIIELVKNNILNNDLIQNNDVIVLGLSGGPDSVFLLYALEHLRTYFKVKYNMEYSIIVCHVNHMIREEAFLDELLAKEYAEKYNLKFYSTNKDVKKIAKENKISEEECGRNIRYEFFENVLRENNGTKIAVAHNANDNAETVLHNLIRGTGLNGLAGIKVKNGSIIRPILAAEKDKILKFLDDNDIKYNIDKTNLESDYTRNKIRNCLIKYIEKEYNPNVVKSLNKMSLIINQDLELIRKIAKEKYESLLIEKGEDKLTIDIKLFLEQEPSIKSRIIMLAINDLLGNVKGIENVHINDICKLLESHITGKSFTIGNKFDVVIERNKIAKFIKK